MNLRKFVRKYVPVWIIDRYRVLRFIKTKKTWRKLNKHNETILTAYADISKISVGRYTYGDINVFASDNTDNTLEIGDFCSIASNVMFFLTGNHRMDSISTFPYNVKFFGKKSEDLSKGSIKVGDDVWIGERAIIMSGVKIGQGAVVAAGAVVTKDVPPYAIVAGNPASIKKYRFSDEIIEKMLTLNYKDIDEKFIHSHKELFEKHVDIENINAILAEIHGN